MATDPRTQAILAEIGELSQSPKPAVQAEVETPQDRNAAVLAEVKQLARPTTATDRNAAIFAEIESIAKAQPPSREQAILQEQEALVARRSQPVISGGSFLEKSLDVLNSPQQALFGLATIEPDESPWQAMVRGMKENTRALDVMEREFAADPASFGNRAIGLAGDLLFDPMLFAAGPLFKGAAKVLKVTGAVGIGAAKFVAPNLSQKLFESAVKPVVRAFSKTALRSQAEKDLIGLIDIEISKAQAATQRILVEENQARQIAVDVAKKLDLPEESVLAEVARRVEVKTKAQLAFPFASLQESRKTLTGAEQLSFADRKEFGAAIENVQTRLTDTADDFAGKADLTYLESREIATQATQLKQRLENALLRERSFGLKTERLDDSTVDYLTHLTTPEAKKALLDMPNFRSFGREFNPRHAFQLARMLDESHPAIAKVIEEGGSANIATLNRLWQEGKLFPQLGPQTSKLFTEDPFVAAAVRRIRGEKAVADAQVLIRASSDRRFALPKVEAPAHYRPVRLPTDARFDRLRNFTDKFRYDSDVATLLESQIETTLLPEGLDKFLKTFDTAQNIWKGLTLAPFPAYHLRNQIGNIWNNWLAGLANPRYYTDALTIQNGTLKQLRLAGKSYSWESLVRMIEDFGIETGTFVEGEVFRKAMPGMSRVFFSAEDIPVLGKAVKLGMNVGRGIEVNSRIAHFLYRLDQGMSPVEAAMSVKKFLFDYQRGLTRFEQSVMRRVFPFYAWTRFNVPLQLQAIVENPRPYIRLSELLNTGRTGPGLPEFEKKAAEYRGADSRYLAQWIKDSVGVPYRIGPTGEPEYFLLSGWLPAGDVNALSAGGFYDRLRNLLSPFLRAPIEQLTNYDLFRLEQIEKYPGETSRFLGVEVRKRNIQMVKNIRLLAEADRVMKLWQKSEDLTDPELSALGAVTRFVFGLKSYEAKPHIEGTKLRRQRTERLRQLKSAVRRELPEAVEVLRGEVTGEEE